MTAFVLTDPKGQIKDRDMLDLYDGYLELALDTKLVKESDLYINPNQFLKGDIFGGHVTLCKFLWKQLGVADPDLSTYPIELQPFLGRNIKEMTLSSFRKILRENEQYSINKSYFVKPVKNKVFTGQVAVLESDISKLQCSSNTDVLVSSYINFGAEFRVYVYKNQVVDAFRYWGDNWRVTIDSIAVEAMVAATKNMPIFYSIDVGHDEDSGKTLLVEVNDGYALGNYGLSPKSYAEMTIARWKEITSC